MKILVIVLSTVRFVGNLAQNLYSNRDAQHHEFRTIKIMTYQYLVVECPKRNFTLLGLSIPHLVAFLAVAYEFADILAHGWPEIFGCDAFVSA